MLKNKKLIIVLASILIVVGGITAFFLTRPVDMPDRGETFLAFERTFSSPDESPVKEDLIQRGLVDIAGEGHVDVAGIDALIDSGIYEIDDDGYFAFGPEWTLTGEYPLEMTRQDAEEIIGNPLPDIGYLPAGYRILGLYLEEKQETTAHLTFVLTAADIASGDELNEDNMEHKILVFMNLYKEGQIGGLKLPGDLYEIGDTKGVLWPQTDTNDLIWLFPYREFPGQYEMHLLAGKDMPVEELLNIARSIE